MKKIMRALLIVAAFLPTPASVANDSSAAIGLGGLELTRNDAISMDSEDLFISQKLVRVKYRFTNNSDRDVETLVSFPLPIIPTGIGGYMGDQSYPKWQDDLDFKTLVDGKPVALEVREVVTLVGINDGKDVGARLTELGWPIRVWDDYDFAQKLQTLPEAQMQSYLKEGLLRRSKDDRQSVPNWQLQTHVTRSQIFPAGKTITVEHSYAPVIGSSVAGNFERSTRRNKEYNFSDYAKHYCIDKAFLKGFDRVRYAKLPKNATEDEQFQATFYGEIWLSYILKSGANWRGPIKDFRLVVDKGSPKNLVSFCMNGVTKISDTQFEVRKTNFEPDKDLDILIVGWASPN
jgi:Domain of unknown function (DUF4424)